MINNLTDGDFSIKKNKFFMNVNLVKIVTYSVIP